MVLARVYLHIGTGVVRHFDAVYMGQVKSGAQSLLPCFTALPYYAHAHQTVAIQQTVVHVAIAYLYTVTLGMVGLKDGFTALVVEYQCAVFQ